MSARDELIAAAEAHACCLARDIHAPSTTPFQAKAWTDDLVRLRAAIAAAKAQQDHPDYRDPEHKNCRNAEQQLLQQLKVAEAQPDPLRVKLETLVKAWTRDREWQFRDAADELAAILQETKP